MSLAFWHFLILWMTLVSCPIMSEARFPYVSEFQYVPGLHPARNPDCPSRFVDKEKTQEDYNRWNRPTIEIRAVLSRCSKRRVRRGYTEGQGITNCSRKIVINMRFNNIGKTETQEKFIVIDHVLDSASMKKVPLQSPYVIKVRQEAVLQLYGLKLQSVVNAEAREEVINNESPNYTGCNVDPENPTCGLTFMHGEPVPFSQVDIIRTNRLQGFCCSCDPKTNARRQYGGWNESLESSGAEAELSYNVANNARNRLAKQSGRTNMADDPVASSQTTNNRARSMKKSNTPLANPDTAETIGGVVFGTANSGRKYARDGSIDRYPSIPLRADKETNNHAGYLVSRKKEATNSRVTDSSIGEKHSGEQDTASSVLVSSTGPEVSPGNRPNGDKTPSDVNIARDVPIRPGNVPVKKSVSLEKQRNYAKVADKGDGDVDESVPDARRSSKKDAKSLSLAKNGANGLATEERSNERENGQEKLNRKENREEKTNERESIKVKSNQRESLKEKPKERENLKEKSNQRENLNEKSNERENLNEKPKERENLKEKSSQRENLNEKSNEREDLNEKPKERENLKEKPKERENLEEKSNERENLNDKSNQSENQEEKPKQRENLKEKSNERENLEEKSNQRENLEEKPKERENLKEKSNERENLEEKSNEKENLKEKPKERENLQEKSNERENLSEKSNQRENLEEKPKERENLKEKSNEKEKLKEKSNEKENLKEKPKERENLQEKSNQRENLEEKPNERENLKEKSNVGGNLEQKWNDREKPNEKSIERENLKEKPKERENLKEKSNERENLQEKSSERENLKEKSNERENINEKSNRKENLKEKSNETVNGKEKSNQKENRQEKSKERKNRVRPNATKLQKCTNSSTTNSFGSGKQESKKKWRKKIASSYDVESTSDKGSSLKKKNKAFPVTPPIDSPAAMHLNEPLKNLSTGVLNSNGSPVSRSARKGNLNGVMGSTSCSPDIRVKSFNEKHGAFVSNDEKSIRTLEGVDLRLISELIVDENAIPRDNCPAKNRPCKGSIESYTPQRRTLKNLSYREKNKLRRDRRNQNEHGVDGRQSERNFRGSNGPFRGGRKRRGSNGSRRRRRRTRRRRRWSKKLDNDEESGNRNSARGVQVFIDYSRPVQTRTSEQSRSSKFAQRRVKPKSEPTEEERNGRESTDNLDKRIEEKLSRINDVLKEDSKVADAPEVDKPKRNKFEDNASGQKDTSDDASRQKESQEETSDDASSEEKGGQEEMLDLEDVEDESGRSIKADPETLKKDEETADNQVDNPTQNKPEEFKTSTPESDVIISPPAETSMSDRFKSTSDLSIDDLSVTKETSTEVTQALIVIDLFKVVTGPMNQHPQTAAPTETPEPSNRSILNSLGRRVEKAFGFQLGSEPTRQTSTSTPETGADTTRITDQAFRPSIKPLEDAARQTSGELHNEVVIDDLTFPEETEPPPSLPVVRRDSTSTTSRSLARGINRRKKKRTTSAVIRNKDSTLGAGLRRSSRFDRSVRDNLGRKDSMKYSIEAGNVNLMKLGSNSGFLREQRNYLQLMVNAHDDAEKTRCGKGHWIDHDRAEVRREASSTDPPRIKWIHHPWFATTESSDYTVKSKDYMNHVMPEKNPSGSKEKTQESNGFELHAGRILPPCSKSKCRRSRRLMSVRTLKSRRNHEKRARNMSSKSLSKKSIQEFNTSNVQNARILPPCSKSKRSPSVRTLKSTKNHEQSKVPTKSMSGSKKRLQDSNTSNIQNDRILPACSKSRRLLSLRTLKSVKNHERSSSKDPKKDVKAEKSKKGNVDSSKKKKGGKNRSKKQLQSSLKDSMEDYDYSMPKEREYEVLEQRQADYPVASLENDGNIPSMDDSRKMSDDLQNDGSFGLLTDGIPARVDNDDESGKDFEISLTGKVHLDGDSNGQQPLSISFDAAPEFPAKASSGTNEYVDRFPPDSAASSYVDSSDNANFLSFGEQSMPVNDAVDRSETVRERNRKLRRYADPIRSQKLLRLRKKSVNAIKDAGERETRSLKGLSETDRRSDFQGSSEKGTNDDPKRDVVVSKEDTKNEPEPVISEDLNNVAPADEPVADSQVSLDLSNEPEASLLNKDLEIASTDVVENVPMGCFALNMTTVTMDMSDTTTAVPETTTAPSNQTILSFHDLDTTEKAATTTNSEQLPNITSPDDDNYVRQETLPPDKQRAVGQAKSMMEYNVSSENGKESTEKKNMLAVAEFVKKLEKLVTNAGNSSNHTGHTLIHLKKFIIVPDNETFWSLGKFSEEPRAPTETRDLPVGEGTKQAEENAEEDIEQRSELEDPDLIKEIISSVIRGDEVKPDESNTLLEDRLHEEEEKHEKGKRSECPVKLQERTKEEKNCPGGKCKTDDQFPGGNPENAGELSKNSNRVRVEGESNSKGKREAGNPIRRERKRETRGKKKEARQEKKKRRRKRKRKSKKNKKIGRKKGSKKSKWPFKRNLLMLSEEEQARSLDQGKMWRIVDKFSLCESETPPTNGHHGGNKFREPQIRGGQDCSDRRHPSKYLESAHCLRFSNLWYSVYQLEEPVISHRIHLQIYAKRSSPDESIFWQDLTNGSSIRLGTFDKRYRDKSNTMDLTYNDIELMPISGHSLDPSKDRLLVPSTMSQDRKYPEDEGWSGEYLVVQADKINEEANECDKAGVGFSAFVNQPDRCERVRGTCLKNQPMDYWRHDVEARDSGRSGCYFLSNFAWVPSEAIKYNVNGTGSREFLALEYHSPHVSVIDVELGADYNALLRAGSYGRLTEVYIDNAAIDYTVITALITNKGSSSSSYRVRITGCPEGLPVSWLNAETRTKTIPSHRDRKVALDLYGRLSLNEFSCSAELLNDDGEPVATRTIRARKNDRCFCIRHCECTCNADGTSCTPMSLKNYHAAGFRGPLPPVPEQPFNWYHPVTVVSLVIICLLLLLLLLGTLKWAIGMCVPAVSRWGLDALLETNKMAEYYESDLKSRSVVFDEFGQPVHPDTGRKSVRICNRKLEFFLNLIFFFIYPLVMCCCYCSKHRQPGKSIPVESKTSLVSEKDETPTMICVSTYGDSVNSKMEAEDTKYVIDELKKSQESLQNHGRYKRKPPSPETIPSSSD